MEKQIFGEQVFPGPRRDNETRVDTHLQALPGVSPTIFSTYSLQIYLVTALSKFLPESFGLDYFQLKIISIPERHFGVANFVSPQNKGECFQRKGIYKHGTKLFYF